MPEQKDVQILKDMVFVQKLTLLVDKQFSGGGTKPISIKNITISPHHLLERIKTCKSHEHVVTQWMKDKPHLFNEQGGLLYIEGRLYIPPNPKLRQDIIVLLPPPSSSGHAYKTGGSSFDSTVPSSPVAPPVITMKNKESIFATASILLDVFDTSISDFKRAQSLYEVFIEMASNIETTSQFFPVMTRIADNLASLGCKAKPCTQHCDRSHCEPCTLEHAQPCTLSHADPCTLPHFFVTPQPCTLLHADPCNLLHIDPCTLSHADPCTLSHAEPCTLAHNEPCNLSHADPCTLNHFPIEPVTVAIPIPCPIAHNELCMKEHVPTRPSTPIPSLSSPDKGPLIDSSQTKQLKRKRFKSSKKRTIIKTEDSLKETCASLAARYGSEPEMDSDGFFPEPIYGLRETLDNLMDECLSDTTSVVDRELREFDRDYPFAGKSPIASTPAVLPTVTPVAPLPTNTTLPLPKVALPRARTEPPLPSASKTSLPLRAQTAPPSVSRNTLTARRCTNKDASPSSFVKFMDVPVTMTREHIHNCLKDNRKWSTVDISNVEIFAIKNKDSTIVNVLKIKFKDDVQSTTAKRVLTTSISFGDTISRRCRPWYLSTRSN
ncbi:hypothetical protein JOM56_011437 [Amanita muscaria]